MKHIRSLKIFLLTGLIVLISCSQGEEIVPQNNQSSISIDDWSETSKFNENVPLTSKPGENEFLKSALKFEAVHEIPTSPGEKMTNLPLPVIMPGNGNRFYLKAPVMSLFSSVSPSEASYFLIGGLLEAELNAFWKAPDNDPAFIMSGTGPAKGDFIIKKEDDLIWKGTITGVRQNLGTEDEPLFQWKGQIKAEGMGEFAGLKLTAIEITDPSPFPAMVYYWSGIITP